MTEIKMIKCYICAGHFTSNIKLSKHISHVHKMSTRQYYDTIIKKPDESRCGICDNETRYVNFAVGYKKYCSSKACRSKSAILIRKQLKENDTKFDEFTKLVATTQKSIWAERKHQGTDKAIFAKSKKTITDNIKAMSDSDRQRFNWRKDKTQAELEIWNQEIMDKTGFHFYRINDPIAYKQIVIRQQASKFGISECEVVRLHNERSEFEIYTGIVRTLTEVVYAENITILDPKRTRGRAFHLDHKFSILQGYLLEIAPELIGSIDNLEMLPATTNLKKGTACSILLEELDV